MVSQWPLKAASKRSMMLAGIIFVFLFFYGNLINSLSDTSPIPIDVKNQICSVNLEDFRSYLDNKNDMKMIYFVTPTYPRPTQVPELIQLSHTLMHVPRIHWIVADDQNICSEEVLNILKRSGLPYTHISSPKPFIYKTRTFPRGVANRRAAIDWIRKNIQEGILYFGDDDNTFDLQLFEEIRKTKRVGMLPVGLIGDFGVSSPVVSDGKVVAFYDSWPEKRMFPVDMAGFAVNIEHLPLSAAMPYILGMEEDKFLLSLGLKMEEIEPLADNCSKVYVWHTKSEKYEKKNLKLNVHKVEDKSKYAAFVNLLKETVKLGMTNLFPENGTVKPYITKHRKSFDVIKGLV